MTEGTDDRSRGFLLRKAARLLKEIDAGNPRLEAEYLLASALDVPRPEILRLDRSEPLSAASVDRFHRLLDRRLAREPLQYVLGMAPFCELELEVGPGVLIPRSETEVLVEKVVQALEATAGVAPRLIDACTGSGAILLALLQRLPGWRGWGTDCSEAALGWARRNRTRAALDDRAFFLCADLCRPFTDRSVEAVVSNPPYIRTEELPLLSPEIREHEPRPALDGGGDGLVVFRRLLPDARRVLRPGGLFAVELSPDQPEAAAVLLGELGGFEPAQPFRDLAGRPRGFLVRRNAEP